MLYCLKFVQLLATQRPLRPALPQAGSCASQGRKVDGNTHTSASLVGKEQVPMLKAIEIEATGQVHILAAIGGDFFHLAFFPPAQGLQSVGAFGFIQGGLAQIIKRYAVAQPLLYPL